MSTVTMQDLDLETAELLPARETLNCYGGARNGNVSSGILNGNQVQVLSGFSVFGNGTAQNGNGNVIGLIG
ncbi:MAG TPA: hypothetical protein VIE45_10115 [Streptosporangiaceae bacterium]|jgi:hypothetical protein